MTSLLIESPSLFKPIDRETSAYELKFLVSEQVAQEIQRVAQKRLHLDPHGVPALGGAYTTTTLYCDTPRFDVYHRSPSFRRRKFRLRRYGDAQLLFLERKSKKGDRVSKRRTALAAHELPTLAESFVDPDWSASWFHRSLRERQLQPTCAVVYERLAYVGVSPDGPIRLTFDRKARGILVCDWEVPHVQDGVPLLQNEVITEFKFCAALPPFFKELLQDFVLMPSSASKYRRCVASCHPPEVLRGEC